MDRVIGEHRQNLRVPLSTFVGREREVAQVHRLLESRRLVTLVGTGGVGKTRLAVRVAMDVLGCYSGQESFVDLAALGDAGLLRWL
jgi:predicted ATPase